MNKTKNKILKTSLDLFNENGIENVRIRDIASKVNIRVGNLNYYFPTKNDILNALCLEFIDKVDEAINEVFTHPPKMIFERMYLQASIIFSVQLEYRFIFTKRYAEILTSLPSVQKYYQKVLKTRFDEWMEFHTILVEQKLAYPNIIKESYALSYILNTLALFWHQETTIYFPDYTDNQKKEHGLSVLFHAYKPYLTNKGLKQLMPLIKELEHY